MLFRQAYYLLSLTILSALGSPMVERQTRPNCTDPGTPAPCTNGILILGARGTDFNYLDGSTTNPRYFELQGLEDYAQAIINRVPNSYCRAIKYPAASCRPPFGPCPYFESLDRGIDEGQRVIRDYRDRCGSSSRIALLGYSSGAQLWTSVLVGDNIPANVYAPHPRVDADPLPSVYRASVRGGALIASPSFLTPPAYRINGGTASEEGILAKDRTYYEDFNTTFSDRIRNYCQADDFYCASGNSMNIHNNAVGNFRTEAIAYLRSIGLA